MNMNDSTRSSLYGSRLAPLAVHRPIVLSFLDLSLIPVPKLDDVKQDIWSCVDHGSIKRWVTGCELTNDDPVSSFVR